MTCLEKDRVDGGGGRCLLRKEREEEREEGVPSRLEEPVRRQISMLFDLRVLIMQYINNENNIE